MKKIKTPLYFILIFCLMLSLAACGKTPDDGSQSKGPEDKEQILKLEDIDLDLSDPSTFAIELPESLTPDKVAGEGKVGKENYTVNGDCITFTEAGINELLNGKKYGDVNITILAGKKQYIIPAHIATKIIRNAYDVAEMMRLATADSPDPMESNLSATDKKPAQPDYYDEADGYFILGENIDMKGEIIRFCNMDGEFKGIIDGRGHAIFNIGSLEYGLKDGTKVRLTNGNAGIFGTLGGVLKNIALVNVICGKDEASPIEEECHRNIAVAYKLTPAAVIENLYLTYVQTEDTTGTSDGSGAIGCIDDGATLQSVLIESINKPDNMRRRGDNNHEIINTVGSTSFATDVYGICCETGLSLPVGDNFRDYEEIVDAELCKYNDFDEKYWDLTGSVPVFKGVIEDMLSETDVEIFGLHAEKTGPCSAEISKAALAKMPMGTNRLYLNNTGKYIRIYKFKDRSMPPVEINVVHNYVVGMDLLKPGATFTVEAYMPNYPEISSEITFTVKD